MAQVQHIPDLLQIAEDASKAIMAIYNARSAVAETKTDGSPVTQADMAAHHTIVAGLTRLFPDIPVVSEEGDTADIQRSLKRDAFWLVDPLDGTAEFLARGKDFTVGIALVGHGVPQFGIIAAPVHNLVYFGGPGYGSFKQTSHAAPVRLHVASSPTKVVLGGRSIADKETHRYIEAQYSGHELKFVGSQLKLAHIAEGLADAFPRLNHTMKLWDLAAGEAIIAGAGGTVRRLDGGPIDYRNPTTLVGDFVASAF